jgi:4-aminobutyrate aminotransferase-like enzyme
MTQLAVCQVRGLGLFIGVELVTDRATLAPAAKLASDISNALARRRVLISTDGLHALAIMPNVTCVRSCLSCAGPLHNVLKLKPPMCFSKADGQSSCIPNCSVCQGLYSSTL